MQKINELTGRNYRLFNYYGDENAESVIVAMGSVGGTMRNGGLPKFYWEKVGFIQVNLYRPFSKRHFMEIYPRR